MNEGCGNQAAAAIKDGLIGCMDTAPGGSAGMSVGQFLCGLTVEVLNGDLDTVQTSGNLFYPRVLVEGSGDPDGDGVADGAIKCSDPVDCTQVRPCTPMPKLAP